MTDHDKLLARMDTWLGTGDSDTADFLCDMRDAAAAIRELLAQLARHDATIHAGFNENAGLRVQLGIERKAREEAERTRDAYRELLAIHNLGGMTDFDIGPMKRALEAEARLAVVERETLNQAIHTVRVVLAGADDGLGYDTLMQLLEDRIDALANESAATQPTKDEWHDRTEVQEPAATQTSAEKEPRPTRRTGLERRRPSADVFEGEYRVLPDWLHNALAQWVCKPPKLTTAAQDNLSTLDGLNASSAPAANPNRAEGWTQPPGNIRAEIARRQAK